MSDATEPSGKRSRRPSRGGPAAARGQPGGERRRLLMATLAALGVAVLLLLVAILPAEYGIDPTGAGRLMGLTDLSQAPAPEESPPAANTTTLYQFSASWPVRSQALDPIDGYVAEGRSVEAAFDLRVPNVTAVRAVLRWTDANQTAGQATRPDVFEVYVRGPDGRTGEPVLGRNPDPGGPGRTVAALAWRQAPLPRALDAPTADDARRRWTEEVPADASGVGPWVVNVTLLEAGDADASGVPLGGPAGDAGNSWNLTLEVDAFELLASGDADAQRTDTAVITVPPGQGLEYKFFLNEGDPLEYEWTAGAAVVFDFHGERPDAAPGEFTSHRSGTAQADQGRLTAPFTGTHGWYWQNDGADPVEIRLVTRGVYAVVGQK